ncbi:hypothetical protein V2S66_27840 [Streptomyces sp. V4-01]|uniref:Uncharacterized protein n=1 Tax=Actinacidiphila polyblastidii TaxID=3110430 RepID=A0ABU7PIX4_9ACTN|nr:hypothetical protein [Streptomyces sp. V4-01]
MPDAATLIVLIQLQRRFANLLTESGPEDARSAGLLVPVAHYFADLRAMVAMIFRSWPAAREYASTACLAATLDAEHSARIARAQPLLNTPGKKKTSKPYTAPPADCLTAGAALNIAASLLDADDQIDARDRLAPLVHQLRRQDLALSTWLRRPSWISGSLRQAVMDLPPRGGMMA